MRFPESCFENVRVLPPVLTPSLNFSFIRKSTLALESQFKTRIVRRNNRLRVPSYLCRSDVKYQNLKLQVVRQKVKDNDNFPGHWMKVVERKRIRIAFMESNLIPLWKTSFASPLYPPTLPLLLLFASSRNIWIFKARKRTRQGELTSWSSWMLNYQLRFGSRPDIALLKSSTLNETRERRKELHKVCKMIRNDITYITRPTSDLMRLVGVWPSIDGDETVWKRVYNFALKIISYVLVLCNLIPGFLYWLIQADSRTRIQMIAYLLYEFMTISQYSIFVFRDNQIKRCLQHVKEDWNSIVSMEKQNIMQRFVRIGKRLAMTCAIIMFTAVIVFRMILPLMQGEIVTVYNVTVRPLACPSYVFFIDLQATPFYEAYFALQCISGIITGSIVTISTGLTAIFVVHASGQLRIVRDLMTKLVEEEWQVEYEVNQKVAEIVNCQIRVRR